MNAFRFHVSSIQGGTSGRCPENPLGNWCLGKFSFSQHVDTDDQPADCRMY